MQHTRTVATAFTGRLWRLTVQFYTIRTHLLMWDIQHIQHINTLWNNSDFLVELGFLNRKNIEVKCHTNNGTNRDSKLTWVSKEQNRGLNWSELFSWKKNNFTKTGSNYEDWLSQADATHLSKKCHSSARHMSIRITRVWVLTEETYISQGLRSWQAELGAMLQPLDR